MKLFLHLFFVLFMLSFSNCAVSSKTSPSYSISGAVIGLHTGEQITLVNNGADRLKLTSNSSFTFSVPVMANGSYAITVAASPSRQVCSVWNSSGAHVTGDVSNVRVVCDVRVLHFFNDFGGKNPEAGLVAGTDGYLYGTTAYGGITEQDNYGTVFKINPADASYTVIHSFTKADGIYPKAALISGRDGYFYGTTRAGGVNDKGTIFKVNVAGAYEVIHSFADQDVKFLESNIVMGADGYLYGTTLSGGTYDKGTIFKLNPIEHSYSVLHSFGSVSLDGASPSSKGLMVEKEGYFYGTTPEGGAYNKGMVFKFNPANGIYQVWHSFGNGTDGISPMAGLLSGTDGYFYGTTVKGGVANQGTIFKINPVNGFYTVIHSFTGTEGKSPRAGLTAGTDGYLYGVTSQGGWPDNQGILFKINPIDGVFTVLHYFTGQDGAYPEANLLAGTDGHFYGISYRGGGNDDGTIFRY